MSSSGSSSGSGSSSASGRARVFIDALARLEGERDAAPIVALFADDAEASNPLVAREPRRADGPRDFWETYRASFDSVRSEFRNVVEGERAAILEWTSTGRTAAGHAVAYDGTSVLEYDGDRITRFRAYFDPADLTDRPDRHGDVGA